MRSSLLLSIPLMAVLGAAAGMRAADAPADRPAGAYRLSFDDLKAGELPKSWKADATNPKGDLAEWQVQADANAPSKPNVLSLAKIADTSRGHFNLCWTPDVKFQDGMLEVKVRANAGEIDQGGGLMWRVKDAGNYCVARYNPLESNFRLYYVKDGKRTQFATAEDLQVKSGQWFTLKVIVAGEKVEGWLDGKKVVEGADSNITEAGGVGLWSKADAASSFDDLVVEPAKPSPPPTAR